MAVRIRLFYFLFFSSVATYFPYVNVYLEHVGLSGTQIGFLASIGPMVSVVAQPLWGLVSDSSGRRKRVLMLLLLASAIISPFWAWSGSFYVYILLATAIAMFNTPIPPVADSIVLGYIEEQSGDYGGLRGYGSVGFAISVLLVGVVLEAIGLGYMFAIYSGWLLASLLVAIGLPDTGVSTGRRGLGDGARKLLSRREFLFFLLSIFLLFVGIAAQMSFLGIYLKRLGAGEGLVGLAFTLAAFSEIPIFLKAGSLINRFGSEKLLVVSFTLYVVRYLLYSIIGNPVLATLVQLMHGFTFGFFYVASVNFVNEHAPSELRTTGQTLFWTFSWGLGAIVGNWVAGYLFDTLGVQAMFTVAAGMCLTAVLLFVITVYPQVKDPDAGQVITKSRGKSQ